MNNWFKRGTLTVLVLLVGYVLTVQVLRWIAFGEEEREALALMEVKTPMPAGTSGFKYLAFTRHEIPLDELDQALAQDLAAYRQWHAGWGVRMLNAGSKGPADAPEVFSSPVALEFPERPEVEVPDAACGFREADCLGMLRGQEDAVRAWLKAEAVRLDLAERALRSDHLANPYPSSADSPIANFQVLRLPVNAIALQALDGDVAGATIRACRLLAAERRFLRQDGQLIDKMLHAALVDGAASLLLGLRRLEPGRPLPGECAEAVEPVAGEDYLACGAFREEFTMISSLGTAMDSAARESRNPLQWLSRWTLIDDRLMRAWSATHFAPMCEPEGMAGILAGQVPEVHVSAYDPSWIDYWAAPISQILSEIAAPTYGQYQDRLLDHGAGLRLRLAAIAAVAGDLPPAQVQASAASPGYQITAEDGYWILPLRRASGGQDALRIAIPKPAQPPAT